MNKTVNINLAGIFFHIDEDAYLKLQRYLEAIKRSFTDSQGCSEIISDIEARISELFSERIKHDKQVIGTKEVDEVITIMGQPEDYLVDDEIFEDDPKTSYKRKPSPSKKLYRDTDNSYVGGVSSGLSHYFGIDTIWIRLAWIILIFGAGTGILLYILLWILVPEAKTTAEKLMMTGEPVNISNIERKIKDGFENVTDVAKEVTDSVGTAAKNAADSVSDAVSNIDFKKKGKSVKSSSKTFFDTIGNVIMFFFKIIAKLIGIELIIIGAVALIVLVIGLFSVGSSSFFHPWWMDYPDALNATGFPIWLGSLAVFFLAGIPLFFIAYLGLKILINNLKSIGNVAKFTLLGLWIISLFTIIFIAARQTAYFTIENSVTNTETLAVQPIDTLSIKMIASDYEMYERKMYRNNGFQIIYDDNDEKIIHSRNVLLKIQSTKDSVATLKIIKESHGKDFKNARESAEKIEYSYELKNNQLFLNNFLTTDYKNKFLDQNIRLILSVPEGTILKLNSNVRSFLNHYKSSSNIVSYNDAKHLLRVIEDDTECLDCPVDEPYEVDVDIHDEDSSLKFNDEGVEVTIDSSSLKIDKHGVKAKGDDIKVNIDDDGITIKSEDD